MAKVPYRNPVEAANDLAEDRVQFYRVGLAIVQPQLQAGKIKLIAMSNWARAPVDPDVPTVAEAGFPKMAIDGLVGLFGPPTMPLALRETIAADVKEVMDADADHQGSVDAHRADLQSRRAGGFAKAIDDQRATAGPERRDLGVKAKQ